MNGPNSTSGNIPPNTTSHPVAPSKSPSKSSSGVDPLDGQRYTQKSETTPAAVSIHMRTPRIQKGVLPQVNREKTVDKLQSGYKAHYAQAEAKRDQLDLAHSLKDIRHFLDNPALAKECTSYSIMWIPDEGEPISVIPPGTELNDRTKATEVRNMLHNQLDTLEQKFTVSKLQQLEEDIEEQEGLMKVAAQQLGDLGAPLPKLPTRERIVLLGGTSAKGAPVAGQSTPPPSTPLPETGQQTTPPTTGATPTQQPHIPEDETTPLPGKFEMRFKKPNTPPQTKPFETLEDEQDEDDSLGSFDDMPSFLSTGQTAPERPRPTEPTFDAPPFKRERLDDEETLFGTTKQQKEASQPLLSFDDESEDLLDDAFDVPSTTTGQVHHKPVWQKPSPAMARPRPKPVNPAPNTIGPLPTSIPTPVVTPVTVAPQDKKPAPLYEVRHLALGEDGRHADIFRKPGSLDDDFLASVSSGSPSLGLADEEESIGLPSGISQRFKRELQHRDDTAKYGSFHRKMLSRSKQDFTHYATQEELQHSPGLASSMAVRADINGKGNHAGTIIIDVFDSDYPYNNETNQAMIYVVPPDGSDYTDLQQYLDDCENTAKRLVWSLNEYNLHLSEDHKREQRLGQQPITTLRTCAFGAGSSRHPGVSASEVADRIARGIKTEMELISQSKSSLTIRKVEFADGASQVFSKPPRPVGHSVTPLEPMPRPKEPVPPPPPALPSAVAMQLRQCPPQVGAALDADMGKLAKAALGSTHKKAIFESKTNTSPVYTGPLHSARKAMLARAMTNFHRKHSQDPTAGTRDARYIPDSVLPAIELGVLSSKPVPHAVMNQNGQFGQYGEPHDYLIKNQIPEATAKAIATATTGYQSNPKSNLLDNILRDVELMEHRRTSEGFDISELETYHLYPDPNARKELGQLCREYYGMLLKQGDLPPPQITYVKGQTQPPVTTFTLSDNGTPVSSDLNRDLNPAMRQHLEKGDEFYTQQINQLKKAAAVPSSQTGDFSSFGQTSDGADLKTFGQLYTFSQGSS